MNEPGDLIKAAAEGAAKGIAANTPPIYTDLLKPGTILLGKGLADVIKLTLAPLTATAWTFDKIAHWLTSDIEEKLKDVPYEKLQTPKLSVFGPAIETIRFLADEPQLRDMFAQLIANSMNKEYAEKVHPGLVEILKSISSNDARMLKYLHGNQKLLYAKIFYSTPDIDQQFKFVSEVNPQNSKTDEMIITLSNLDRLGLTIVHDMHASEKPYFEKTNAEVLNMVPNVAEWQMYGNRLQLSPYGELLCQICL